MTFNCAFSLVFSVADCKDAEGTGITAEQYRAAIEKRMNNLDSEGDLAWQEAIGAPEDHFEEGEF